MERECQANTQLSFPLRFDLSFVICHWSSRETPSNAPTIPRAHSLSPSLIPHDSILLSLLQNSRFTSQRARLALIALSFRT